MLAAMLVAEIAVQKVAELDYLQPIHLPHGELVEPRTTIAATTHSQKNHTNLSNTIPPRLF
ncbi:hypothetical protein FHW17_003739 [Phyllobacterium sp. P30BS-XVII]|nr:hypothetical protein [Phyllobacterium sp. P30BS-XVII]